MTRERNIGIRLGLRGGREVEQQLERVGTRGQQALRRVEQATRPASAGLQAVDAASRELTRGMEGMARSMGPAGRVLTALGPAGLAAAAGIAAVGLALASAVREAERFERLGLRTEAIVEGTGHAAGLTATEIRGLSEEIARATLASAEGVETAAQRLAAFTSVINEEFERTLRAAQDLAAAGFGTIESNAVALGRALEDPRRGLERLERQGIIFTRQQKELIQSLADTNRLAEAQDIILSRIEATFGGVAAREAAGLAGAFDGLGQSWSELMRAFGESAPLDVAIRAIGDLASALDRLRERLFPDTVPLVRQGELLSREIVAETETLVALEDRLAAARDRAAAAERRRDELRQRSPHLFPAGEDVRLPGADVAGARAEVERLAGEVAAQRAAVNALIERSRELAAAVGEEEDARRRRREQAERDRAARLAEAEAARLQREAEEEAAKAAEEAVRAAERLAEQRTEALDGLVREVDALDRTIAARAQGEEAVAALGVQLEREATLRRLGLDAIDEEDTALRHLRDAVVELIEAKHDLAAVDRELQADQALIAGLIAEGTTEQERHAERVAEVEAALRRLASRGIRPTAAELARLNRALRDADPAARAAREAQEELARTFERTVDDIVRFSADRIADIWTNFEGGADRAFQNIVRSFRAMLARMVAEAVVRPIVVQVVGAVTGGVSPATISRDVLAAGAASPGNGGGSGGSGLQLPGFGGSGLFPGLDSFLGRELFQLPTAFGTVPGGVEAGTGAVARLPGSFSVGNALTAAGSALSAITGFMRGGAGGTLQGVGGTAATILSFVPGLQAFAAPVAVASALLGGLLGGDRPSVGPIGHQVIGMADGRLTAGPAFFDNTGSFPTQVAEQTGLAVTTINDLADALGLAIGTTGFGGIRFGGDGRGDPLAAHGGTPGAFSAQEFVLDFLRRPDAFRDAPAALTELLRDVSDLDQAAAAVDAFLARRDQLEAALDAMAAGMAGLGDSVERAARAVRGELVAQIEALRKEAERFGLDAGDVEGALRAAFDEETRQALMGLTRPHALLMERLEAEQQMRRAVTEELGADLVRLEELFAAERRRVMEQAVGDLRGFLDDLTLDRRLSPHSATEQLAEARGLFARALGEGDVGAAQREAMRVLAFSRDVHASSPAFQQDLAAVRRALEELGRDLGLPGFATGTSYAPGGPAIVGERGPEIVTLPKGARVASHGESRGMLAGIAQAIAETGEAQAGLLGRVAAAGERADRRLERVEARLRQIERRIAGSGRAA